jgi:hypothetical protein
MRSVSRTLDLAVSQPLVNETSRRLRITTRAVAQIVANSHKLPLSWLILVTKSRSLLLESTNPLLVPRHVREWIATAGFPSHGGGPRLVRRPLPRPETP